MRKGTEKKMKSTLSFRMSPNFNEGHNLRTLYVPYVNKARSKDNIYYINHTREEAYEYLFGDAVKEYNDKQKRKDRKIENYLYKILSAEEKQKKNIEEKRAEGASKKQLAKMNNVKHSAYEIIVSLGNIQQNPEFSSGGEKMESVINILDEYIRNFSDRNPNAYMYMSAIHLDECGNAHAHIDTIFYSDSYTTGLKRRVSLNKALEDMGFETDEKSDEKDGFNLAVTKWQNREREELTKIALKYGIEIVCGNQSRQHLDREQYIIKKQKEELLKKETSIKNCISQLNDFINSSDVGNAFYYKIELEKKEKELAETKKELEKFAVCSFEKQEIK